MTMHFKSDYRRALPSIALLPLLFADIGFIWLGCAVPTFFLIFPWLFNIPLRVLKRVLATIGIGDKSAARLNLMDKQSFAAAEFVSNLHNTWRKDVHSSRSGKSARVTLYTCVAHSRPGLSQWAKRIKLTARGMRHYRITRNWLAYWNATPMRAELAKATPRLLQKIYRPYQSLRLRSQDRFNVLVSHYDFIFQRGLGALVLRAARSQVLLGSFSGKTDSVYEIRLSAIAALDREGELTLDLYSDQRRLFSIAFTFYKSESIWCIGLGCLQGPRGNDAQERVRHATRDMFGLRPKALMTRLVREIGRAYGCKNVILVGNKNRVLCHQVHTGKVLADYDEFWQEMGAMRRPDGDHQLPCDDIPIPNLQDVPSHKRSEARKRIDLMGRVIQVALTGFSGSRI